MGACFTRATDHAWKTTKRFFSLFYSLSLCLSWDPTSCRKICVPNATDITIILEFRLSEENLWITRERKKTGRSVRTDFLSNEKICLSWSGQVKRIWFVAILWLLNIASTAPVMARNTILWEPQKMQKICKCYYDYTTSSFMWRNLVHKKELKNASPFLKKINCYPINFWQYCRKQSRKNQHSIMELMSNCLFFQLLAR